MKRLAAIAALSAARKRQGGEIPKQNHGPMTQLNDGEYYPYPALDPPAGRVYDGTRAGDKYLRTPLE